MRRSKRCSRLGLTLGKKAAIEFTAMPSLEQKISELRRLLSSYERVLVCFSGGVDSSYLLAEAVRSLNGGAVAFTAVSPSLAPWEGEEAAGLARRLGARHLLVETHEVDDPRYASNPVNRCYFCKTEVYGVAVEEARKAGIDKILDGFNRDDRGDHRPGRKSGPGTRHPVASGRDRFRKRRHTELPPGRSSSLCGTSLLWPVCPAVFPTGPRSRPKDYSRLRSAKRSCGTRAFTPSAFATTIRLRA